MTSRADLQRVLNMEHALGERDFYASEKAYKNAPEAMGDKGIRVDLSWDLQAKKVNLDDFGVGDLCTRKADVDEAKVFVIVNPKLGYD